MSDISKVQVNDTTYNISDKEARNQIYNTLRHKSCVSFAHRGLSSEAPENTTAAIVKAGQVGCYGVEIDIQATSDNEIVVIHDTTIDRMTTGTGTVNNMTLAQIQSYTIDSGENVEAYIGLKIPTLQQALMQCNLNNLVPMLELKGTWTTTNYEKLFSIIEEYNVHEKVIIISFVIEDLQYIRSIDKNIQLAYLYDIAITEDVIDAVIEIGNCGLSLNYSNNSPLSSDLRNYMIQHNVAFGFWTVNNFNHLWPLKSQNHGFSFIVSNYGWASPRLYSKQMIGYLAGSTLKPWMEVTPSTYNYEYDLFSVSLTDSTNNEYTLTYDTPFGNQSGTASTVVFMQLETVYKNNYSIKVRAQGYNSFKFTILNQNNTPVSFSTFTSACGATYVSIVAIGYF